MEPAHFTTAELPGTFAILIAVCIGLLLTGGLAEADRMSALTTT